VIIRKYVELLGRWKPKCLSTTKTVKGKCDGIFSSDEVCDEYGTTSTCCTSDCKLKPGAVCSPVSFNFKNQSIPFFSLLVHVVNHHVNFIQLVINAVKKVNVKWKLNV
jgi:hypothetical protein